MTPLRERMTRVLTTAKFDGRVTLGHVDDTVDRLLDCLTAPPTEAMIAATAGLCGGYGAYDNDCIQADPIAIYEAMTAVAVRERL